jgi:hypothetical protein
VSIVFDSLFPSVRSPAERFSVTDRFSARKIRFPGMLVQFVFVSSTVSAWGLVSFFGGSPGGNAHGRSASRFRACLTCGHRFPRRRWGEATICGGHFLRLNLGIEWRENMTVKTVAT